MPRDYTLSPAATLADVSDRAARDLGSVGIEDLGTTGDGLANVGVVLYRNQAGAARGPFVGPLLQNGSTWDRMRNLQAGNPKFSLLTGLPVHGAAEGGSYYEVADVARVIAAVNQFNVYRIRNPAASGVTVKVTYIAVRWSAARRFVITTPNQADANRTSVISVLRKRAAAGAPGATFSFDNNVAANLGVVGHGEVLVANTVREYKEPLTITAGNSVDVQIGDVGDAAGELGDISAEWYEEA